jgi:hypothetical protein
MLFAITGLQRCPVEGSDVNRSGLIGGSNS